MLQPVTVVSDHRLQTPNQLGLKSHCISLQWLWVALNLCLPWCNNTIFSLYFSDGCVAEQWCLIAICLGARCDLHALSTQDACNSPLTLTFLSLSLFPPVCLSVSLFLSLSLSLSPVKGSWHEMKRLLKQDKVIFNYCTGILAVQ